MTTFQISVILEALAKLYSSQELSAAESVVSSLVNHLGFSSDQAEALVAGALHLKEVRARLGELQLSDTYIQ
jgi:hypothetical protein